MKTMIISFVPIFIAWLCFAIIYRKRPSVSFLDRAHSDILRGYAICGIFIVHVGQGAGANGIELIGAIGVSLFILLSGYGLQESYKKNGVKRFWQKKLLRIYFPYILIEVIWFIVSKSNHSLKEIILDFTLIDPLHPFGWYLRYLMVCYIIFYLSSFIKRFKTRMISIGVAFAVWFIVRSTVFVDQTPFIQARQTLAFPIGILLSLYIDKIRVLLSSRRLVAILSVAFLAFGVGIYAFLHFSGYGLGTLPLLVYNFISLFTCVFCALGIIGLTHLIKPLQNAFMQKVSIFTLEIYLLHGYLISYNSLTGNYPGILLLDVLLCITSVIMHYICAYALNLIKHVIERKDNA